MLFVQPWASAGTAPCVELTEFPSIELVHCARVMRPTDVLQFRTLLSERRIRFPLLWIYNTLHYEPLVAAMPQAFRAFHATEDFFTPSVGWELDQVATAESVRKQFSSTDLLIAVSDGVLSSCQIKGGYRGAGVVVENGCDAAFFIQAVDAQSNSMAARAQDKVAIYQGGINKRLDYSLLHRIVRLLPDWHFRFCGSDEHAGKEWRSLLACSNVQYLGNLEPTEVANAMCSATVGLIPFVQDEWISNSFPLKALEYVACGLPVVSVPIVALNSFSTEICFARTALEFSDAILAVAKTRTNSASLSRRRQVAQENSYDRRFAVAIEALLTERERIAHGSIHRFSVPVCGPSAQEWWMAKCRSLFERSFRPVWRLVPQALRVRLKSALGRQ